MKKAVLYARVSSREQEREGYSIPAQLKLLKQYAISNGFDVSREFIDIETAKAPGRKAFEEMVHFFRKTPSARIVLVEKTDRLYRNHRDSLTLQDLNVEIHLVKENQVISKDSKSSVKFIHDIHVAVARNYSENLKEEVRKGMREKAEQGTYPGRAPLGYKNNRGERTISVHPENSKIVQRIFELYATGRQPLSNVRKAIRSEFGLTVNRAYLHTILTNTFYIGRFVWAGQSYQGTHETFISHKLFESVQDVLLGKNKGKYSKHDIAFRGVLTCAYDDCTVTAELKKGKYVYYRCSGYRGKCDLPRFREEEISAKLGAVLKDISIPDFVLQRIVGSLKSDQKDMQKRVELERERFEQRLANVRKRMDQAYTDKLEGKIPEEFWQRKSADWQAEEQQITVEINRIKNFEPSSGLLSAQRILELANKAYFLYVTRKPAEQAALLKTVLLNCAIDSVSVYPTYRKPFDMIFKRAKREEWSGRADLNCRPLAPQASALPG